LYTISNLLAPFFLPAGLVALGLLGCIVLALRQRARAVAGALIGVFAVYYLAATWPLGSLLVDALERQAPAADKAVRPDGASAIVVLAGAASDAPPERAELNGPGWRRLWRGVELFWELEGRVPLIFSGGAPRGALARPGDLARRYALRFGIPADDFWLEGQSRTTYESGLAVRALLDEKFPGRRTHRILLVTSAWHMPRAVPSFARLAMEVVPVPCDFRSGAQRFGVRTLVPTYEALATSSFALREWIGLAVYRLRGA